MKKHFRENEVYLVAAGKQTRYKSPESKLMMSVHGKPAFAYLFENILSVFPEELIYIITSSLFEDFNNYIYDSYPKVHMLLDNNPGQGSAFTLRQSFPWGTTDIFASEANIYYESSLIDELFRIKENESKKIAVVSITSRVNVAPTHTGVEFVPSLSLKKNAVTAKYRNIGAYVLSKSIQPYFTDDTPDVIDVLNTVLNETGSVVAHEYKGEYLHTAKTDDVVLWEDALESSDKSHR